MTGSLARMSSVADTLALILTVSGMLNKLIVVKDQRAQKLNFLVQIRKFKRNFDVSFEN